MRLKPLVLCIEDDPIFRNAIESVLSRLGLNAKAASNSTDFFELAEKLKPDLYLVDLMLDKEDGFDVILKIRKQLGPATSVIVLSGAKDMVSIEKAIQFGANDFITKPLDRRFLVAKLSKYLTTDELENQRNDQKIIPVGGRALGKLSFRGQLTEIDEFGVKIQSSTLIPNGMVLKLSTDFLLKLGLPSRECLIAVTESWLDPATRLYGHYAEFDGADLQFLERVRHWLLPGG